MNGSWRSSTVNSEWQNLRRGAQEPPHEPDGPCQYAGCPRQGSAVTGDLVACGYHRGDETVRAGRRTTGHRSSE